MNKHKAYWSQMHDERKEPSQREKDYEEFRKIIQKMFAFYDYVNVTNVFREEYEKAEKKINYFY